MLSLRPDYAHSADVSFIAENSAFPLKLSLIIDHAEKIAGTKVTISYDKELLTLKSAAKSKATSSFLHVVNDKTPGKVIIVMASAKGISGDNVTLCSLEFTRNEGTKDTEGLISVTQIQLMDENLKEIKSGLPAYSF